MTTRPTTATRPRSLAERPLREWPSELRPTERLYETGAVGLSDAELLALILGTHGNLNPVALASELIVAFDGWRGLQAVSVEELARQPRMNRQRAARVKAALDIGRRLLLVNNVSRPQIKSPADAAQLLMVEMSHLDQEHLKVIILDTKNRILKLHTVYIGTLNSSNVRVGEVFKEAVRLNAAALIVSHNHPSGDPTPSPDDVMVTRQIVDAGKLLDVETLDHLVIGRGKFVSMRERGLGFSS
jgi:DNA repair protein RadC